MPAEPDLRTIGHVGKSQPAANSTAVVEAFTLKVPNHRPRVAPMNRYLPLLLVFLIASPAFAQQESKPFGDKFPNLDGRATGEWWKKAEQRRKQLGNGNQRQKANAKRFIEMDVPREDVVAFAVYTHDRGVLKLSAQLFPLKPGESMETRLEFKRGEKWGRSETREGLVSRLEFAFPRQELGQHEGRRVSSSTR